MTEPTRKRSDYYRAVSAKLDGDLTSRTPSFCQGGSGGTTAAKVVEFKREHDLTRLMSNLSTRPLTKKPIENTGTDLSTRIQGVGPPPTVTASRTSSSITGGLSAEGASVVAKPVSSGEKAQVKTESPKGKRGHSRTSSLAHGDPFFDELERGSAQGVVSIQGEKPSAPLPPKAEPVPDKPGECFLAYRKDWDRRHPSGSPQKAPPSVRYWKIPGTELYTDAPPGTFDPRPTR